MRKLIIVLCVVAAAGLVVAQSSETFEVASVKANKAGERGGMLRRQAGGRMTATNMPVRQLLMFAYQLAPYQVVGGPDWINTDGFDINAKMEGNPQPIAPGTGIDPMQIAVQHLLADRFALTSHREMREMDVFQLVMIKPGTPGPNLKPSVQDCAAQAAAARRGGAPPAPPGPPGPPAPGTPFCGIFGGPGRLRFGGLQASMLVQAFSAQSGRMVVDKTGLTGPWDFELTFAPEQRGFGPGPGPDAPAADPNLPNFFTAIQEQLGLKLEPAKGPVDVLVVDSVQRPVDD